jgi:MoaA/NifB/PqqE/SkfB family radical SAM enzyme
MGLFDHSQYVSMTMEFRCNLKCVHCMIEGTMDTLVPQSTDGFKQLLDYNRKEQAWKGLILTGSEVTLYKNLPELARMAKDAGFEHVRIQTHGMHLDNARYCKSLIDAGVDEFFVSMPGSNPDNHDSITEVPGSFARTMQGLSNLEQYAHVTAITNTVVTELSYRLLEDIVNKLSGFRQLKQMEFWVFWPMNEKDEKGLAVNHLMLLPYLKQAIRKAVGYGRAVEIKNFPQCLLGEEGHYLLNDQPQLFIDPAFWDQFARNGFYQCKHREACSSKQCLGLNTAYINKFGWHEAELHPI